MKKTIKYVVLGIIAILVVVVLGLFFLFHDELSTLNSVKEVNGYPMYEMTYKNDCGLDKLLKKGASNDQELVQFASKQLLKGLPLKIDIPKVACTTFSATTPNGQHLFGRNFDLEYSPSMVVKTAPKDGYKSISMVDLKFLGLDKQAMNHFSDKVISLAAPYIPFDGINEKGVSAAVLWVPDKVTNQQTGKPDITTSVAIRMILDKAKDTNQAIALLKKYDMHASADGCYHFQLNDAKGHSAVVEYENNKMSVIPQTGNHQVLTNFYETLGSKYHHGIGFDRYNVANNHLNQSHGIETEEQGLQLLNDVHDGPHMPYKDDDPTQWTVLYNNSKKTMTVMTGANFKKQYHYHVN
ncbi:Penicillin V acylase-like amidase [Fructilactobacillus fructivorans]|uniref:linear amide C-N hydrolase n=1 Tax=Fructilactobacillus fructivorans TaxID=1614 RepID=UPI000704E550|nr:linear amide C-N hydrolase [Fructilactobacillus fructivorans]KRN13049.1 Penicillin V acylase-like amidase [Fructilactobacillus fructivorans]